MPTPRRWSLVVPLVGLAAAVLLLPVASARWVPIPLQPVLGYLVVWVPLGAAAIAAAGLASRRSEARWWIVLAVRSSITGVIVGVFVGLLARSIAFVIELLATGRIAGGSVGIDGTPGGTAGVWGFVLASALVAPVIEEAFFRGVLQPALVERAGETAAAAWVGILVTAALFAGVHALAGSSIVGAVVTFVAGVGFGVVARSSGVTAAVVAHVVFNASGIALLLANTAAAPHSPTLVLG